MPSDLLAGLLDHTDGTLQRLIIAVVAIHALPGHEIARLLGTGVLSRWDARRDLFAGMWALVEAQGAGQGVLDEVFRDLSSGDPMVEDGDVSTEQVRVVHRVGGGQQLAHLPQAQAGLLAHQDHGHARQVGVSVAALPSRGPAGCEQAHAFPMSQDMRGQAEPVGQLADGEVPVRSA